METGRLGNHSQVIAIGEVHKDEGQHLGGKIKT